MDKVASKVKSIISLHKTQLLVVVVLRPYRTLTTTTNSKKENYNNALTDTTLYIDCT